MNFPIDLTGRRVLLAGIGGGYDIFAGLPLTRCFDAEFVLSNYSIDKDILKAANAHPENKIVIKENIQAVYSIGRNGVNPVKKAYQKIIEDHQIDILIAMDGGVDSLMRGDEEESGTILEDFINLAALDSFNIEKYLVCLGFGCETEENVNHYRVLENMAGLASAFVGCCALTPGVIFDFYKNACELAWANDRKSHIHTKIISAVLGNFGNKVLYDYDPNLAISTGNVFVNPLMSVYWVYKLEEVIKNNLLINKLKISNLFSDAIVLLKNNIKYMRDKKVIPL